MDKIEKEASQWLTDYLGKLSGVELTEPERHAAFQLLCTLPDSACLKDFVAAASAAKVKQAGLPESVALHLVSLVARLEQHLSSDGLSSLFESRSGIVSVPESHA
ncbi:hypothetical protein PSP6_1010003 [Paraburkholderia tropica]|uniref:hypothetical protein n=1 Tax=Paraburkholderia tropica TaxID=92647 RepID=UPI001CAF4B30|nr:hypothetical protein [Paraburkholderia tropica]CAG9191231.1 hypothetical protein PSP6_1010003 [Paraburkholderia tropica]